MDEVCGEAGVCVEVVDGVLVSVRSEAGVKEKGEEEQEEGGRRWGEGRAADVRTDRTTNTKLLPFTLSLHSHSRCLLPILFHSPLLPTSHPSPVLSPTDPGDSQCSTASQVQAEGEKQFGEAL
ncbi:hypothetical protein E2C01_009871 [Portunus trituberculatus]|uniref:Uncharacterized protein n=1 Tax=Portunus trituberculatus TaxID=210409 RepID=A0A5B7D765_PORTR|nr:hypothetical protein [Portunus trituberculatus]